ncbi:hypothetical protein D3C72_2437060 [compost metagenome]
MQRIDADDALAAPEIAGGGEPRQIFPRLLLLLRRHGILEVENHRVAVQVRKLFQRPAVDGRHAEHRAAQAGGMDETVRKGG